MSLQAEFSGETSELFRKLKQLSNINKHRVFAAIGEGLRTSTMERFAEQRGPDGTRWQPSIRVTEDDGKTLSNTGVLRASIHVKADSNGVAVGTNDIRAATLQYGDTRTIRAKNKKYLRFRVGDSYARVKSVTITIPARPFLGINTNDENEIKDILEQMVEDES